MKRIALITLLIFGTVVLASAQGQGRDNRNWGRVMPAPRADMRNWNERRPQPGVPRFNTEEVTVTGDLTIVQGSLAVKSGGVTYLTMGLRRYVGFIDGLKDGARVTIAGRAISRSEDAATKFLMITKLTIAGKDYDLGLPQMTVPNRPALPNRPQIQPRQPSPPQPLPNRRR